MAYNYDAQGNLLQLTAGVVNQTYTYFEGDILKSETLQVDGKTLTLQYGYDANQALKTLTYPDGSTIDMAPNAFGAATQAGGYATNTQYFPDGQIKQFTFGNGITHNKVLNSRKLPQFLTDSNSAMDYSYTYDNQGNVTAQVDRIDSAYSITNMTYDGLERLTGAKGYWGDVNISYDVLGNITQYNFDNSAQAKSSLPSSSLSYNYDANNRLKNLTGFQTRAFQYDNRGNVTNNGRNNFKFNLAQRLESSDFSAYVYDGHGRRVKKFAKDGSSTEYSLYSQAGRLIYREKDGQPIKYIFLNNRQVTRIDNNIQYVHTDLLGSPVAETDIHALVIPNSRMHYRPFGATIEQPKNDVGYTGHKFDTDIQLSYMQQRYYDPEIGLFMSNESDCV